MATKRIYQIAKELEREEKEIIEFLTAQGIKVGNRLSAVGEDTYNMLKAKFTAPPEPEPEPEPEPKPEPKPKAKPKAKPEPEAMPEPEAKSEPAAQTPPSDEQPETPGKKKKKKKKKKKAQPEIGEGESPVVEFTDEELAAIQPEEDMPFNRATQSVLLEGMIAGSEFIAHYSDGLTKKQRKETKPRISMKMHTWEMLHDFDRDEPDSSPARYWDAVARLTTMAFRLNNDFGLTQREDLAKLRNLVAPVGAKYEPREIFTDEENALFARQQNLLFTLFGSGMGAVNDNIFDLKIYAERMKMKYEFANLTEYVNNPADELRGKARAPFGEVLDAICAELKGELRRYSLYKKHSSRIEAVVKNFFEWLDGYAKLKEQGADAAKLEKYLKLEKKFIDLAEFMSFDNLLLLRKDNPTPFDKVLALLNEYRDNMDDPDAERNFKYKVRGITQIIYKPKEFVFLYRFGELESQKDYRPPEEIAAAEAAKAAKAAAKAAKAAEEAAKAAETTESAETAEPAEVTEPAPEE